MEEKIYNILNELGVPFNLSGRDYLARAVELALQNGRMSVTKELYPQIAKEFISEPNCVERAIRHAVERVFNDGNVESIIKYFGLNVSYSKGKLTNSGFIYGLVEYLRLHR